MEKKSLILEIPKSFVKGIFWIWFSLLEGFGKLRKQEYRYSLFLPNIIGVTTALLFALSLFTPLYYPVFFREGSVIFYLVTGLIASVRIRKLWGKSFFVLPGQDEIKIKIKLVQE